MITSRNNEKLILAGCGAIALAVLAWAYLHFRTDEEPFVAEIKALAEEPPTPENRDAMRDVMRQQFDGKSDEERRQMFEQMAPVFMPIMARRFEVEYDKFMAMTPEERRRELDRRIDAMEEARKNGGGPPGAGGGPGGGTPPSAQQMDEFRKKMLDWTTPDQRAKFESGMQMMNQRRQERGLEPIGPPGSRR